MTKQAVRVWKSVLGQLAALSKISSTTPADFTLQHAALLRIKLLLVEIDICDTPQGAWKRIINEMKVGVAVSLMTDAVTARCNPSMPYRWPTLVK